MVMVFPAKAASSDWARRASAPEMIRAATRAAFRVADRLIFVADAARMECSPDGAKRNPGQPSRIPLVLNAGYSSNSIRRRLVDQRGLGALADPRRQRIDARDQGLQILARER